MYANLWSDEQKSHQASGRGRVKKKALLAGVIGKFAGQSFDLGKGKLVIG